MSGGGYHTKKHDQAVRDACHYLATRGWIHAEKRAREGEDEDRGDVAGIPGVVIEVKTAKTPRWRDWLDQLAAEVEREAIRTGHRPDGWILWRPPGKTDPVDWLVVRSLYLETTRARVDEGWDTA